MKNKNLLKFYLQVNKRFKLPTNNALIKSLKMMQIQSDFIIDRKINLFKGIMYPKQKNTHDYSFEDNKNSRGSKITKLIYVYGGLYLMLTLINQFQKLDTEK